MSVQFGSLAPLPPRPPLPSLRIAYPGATQALEHSRLRCQVCGVRVRNHPRCRECGLLAGPNHYVTELRLGLCRDCERRLARRKARRGF